MSTLTKNQGGKVKAIFNAVLSLVFLAGLMFGIKTAIDSAYGEPVGDDQVSIPVAVNEQTVASVAFPTAEVEIVSQPTTQSTWDCGLFYYSLVPDCHGPNCRDGYKGYFPEEPLQRVNSKLQIVNEVAKEKNVSFLALLFVWWKEGAKGTEKGKAWVFWRAALKNSANGDGVVGMYDEHYKSDQAAYSAGEILTDQMLRTQLRDAAKVLQEKARVAAIRYGGESPLTYQMPAGGKATMLAVEGYNKFTYREKGTPSPYIEGVEGYRTFVRIMTSVWVGCR